MAAIAGFFAGLGVSVGELLAIWTALAFASLIRAFTGFGFALAAVPALSLFVAPAEAVVLTAMLTLAVTLLTVRTFWSDAPKADLRTILLFSVPGTAVGAWLLGGLSPAQFQLWIGGGVLAASLALSVYRPAGGTPWRGVRELVGILSGLMNGAFAIPGPPVVIYAMATQPDPLRARAMLITFFMASALAALVVFAVAGYVGARSLGLFALSLPVILLADKLGFWLFRRHGNALYRRVALVVLYGIGLSTLCKGLSGYGLA